MNQYMITSTGITREEWEMPLSEFLKSRYKHEAAAPFEAAFAKVVPDESSHSAFAEISVGELFSALGIAGLAVGRKIEIVDPRDKNNKYL